jgi:hypothetical protein
MKTLSIDMLNRIKWFLSVTNSGSGVKHSHRKDDRLQKDPRLQKDTAAIEMGVEGREKFDLALFQRKAYHGNYFVGPYIFLNPDLFD